MGFRFAKAFGCVARSSALGRLTCRHGRPPGFARASLFMSLSCPAVPSRGLRTLSAANVYTQSAHNCELPGISRQATAPALIPGFCEVTSSREEPLDHHVLTALPGGQRLPLMAQATPDPGQVAGAVAGYLALREFRARLYRCLTARADALFELADAILCADHAVTSLVQLSLVPEFRRGHGALYHALAAGDIDEEALAALLTGTLPQLIDGCEGRAWVSGHDRIDYGLLGQALARVPPRRLPRSGRHARGGPSCVRDRRHPLSPPGRRMLTRPRARPS